MNQTSVLRKPAESGVFCGHALDDWPGVHIGPRFEGLGKFPAQKLKRAAVEPEANESGGSVSTLLLATGNAGKVREYQAIFAGLSWEPVSLAAAGVSLEIAETGATFRENAILKAVAAARAAGQTAAHASGCWPCAGAPRSGPAGCGTRGSVAPPS